MFSGGENLKMDANRTHWGSAFNSTISDRDRKEREKSTAQYTSPQTPLGHRIERIGSLKYGCYKVLVDTRVG